MARRLSLLLLILGLAVAVAVAEERDSDRIARLSYLEGHVSFQHSGEVDWSAAGINMALQPGDRIYTGENGRAEIEFDDGSVLRLAEETDIEILSMKEELIQIRILLGLSTLTVHSGVGFEINTPAAAFNTLRKGVYRFDVAENGDSDGIVRKGLLDAANNKFSRRVESGELIHVTPGENSTNLLSRYEQRDAWDEWSDRRDADRVAYESRRYLPDFVVVGVRDLDRYGRWVEVDSYGPAWVPAYVDPWWTPYWEGRWYYRPFWGWTWISYEPWGWLPYHYGRWHHSAMFGWCWLPGPSFSFHFWSPGLVRFYHGPGWLSWCPLGPGDYYNVNQYHYNRAYTYQLNKMRLLQSRGAADLANRHVPGAFRTVDADRFVNGSLGGRARLTVTDAGDQPWKRGRIVTEPLDIRPTALSYAPAPDRPAGRRTLASERPVVVRTEPPARSLGNDRLIRITNPEIAPLPEYRRQSAVSTLEAEPQGRALAGTGRVAPGAPASKDATRNREPSGEPAPGIWNRRTPSNPEPASDRISRSAPSAAAADGAARYNERAAPGSSTQSLGVAPRRQDLPSTGTGGNLDGGTRGRALDAQRNPAYRPENSPTRRQETVVPPAPQPRTERPAPPPEQRQEADRPRPESKPRPSNPPESYSYSSRASAPGPGMRSSPAHAPSAGGRGAAARRDH